MTTKHRMIEILVKALDLTERKDLHASEALLQVLSDLSVSDVDRKAVQNVYADAIISMSIGHGIDYDKELLREALRSLDTNPPQDEGKKRRPKKEKVNMTDNTNTNDTTNVQDLTATTTKARAGRSRKYNVGDRFPAADNFGLQPAKAKDGEAPTVEFQLSYREKKSLDSGFSILPKGAEMIYLGCRNVFSTTGKKMVFKILAGTKLLDGSTLDRDIEAAGVVSHILGKPVKATTTETTEADLTEVA